MIWHLVAQNSFNGSTPACQIAIYGSQCLFRVPRHGLKEAGGRGQKELFRWGLNPQYCVDGRVLDRCSLWSQKAFLLLPA